MQVPSFATANLQAKAQYGKLRPVQDSTPITPTPKDPQWRLLPHVAKATLPADAPQWLLHEGSLTALLIDKSGGDFRVERISQRWQVPHPSERQLLGLPDRQWALVREVTLQCHNEAWVYARSVLPAATLAGPLRYLRRLRNESLGSLLFQDPNLKRGPFEIVQLPPYSAYIHASLRQPESAWARRSRFSLHGRPLSVSEVFLKQFQP